MTLNCRSQHSSPVAIIDQAVSLVSVLKSRSMADMLIGPYRLVRKLSAGGMGTVYEAMHETIERWVAIKILHQQHAANREIVRRFFNEAKAANRIDHPGIVQIYDCGQLQDGTAYIVMELLKGETLGKRLRRPATRRLLSQNLRLIGQVTEALAAAHAVGIIHRDMKPDNVMVIGDPESSVGERAKILDFGIAKLRAQAGGNAVTKDNLLGTPTYMSPEQCRGGSALDPKTDVYAVGIMLYRLVAARPPFVAAGAGEVLAMHMFSKPPPLKELAPWIPDDLAEFIHQLLAKEPEARPTMLEVSRRMSAFSKTLEGFVIPTDPDKIEEPDPGASMSESDTGGVLPTLTSGAPETPPSWQIPDYSEESAPVSRSGHSGPQKTTHPSIGAIHGQQQADTPTVRRHGPLLALAGGIGLLVVVASAALFLTQGSRSPQPAASNASGTQSALKSARVRWHITSLPAGADVRRAEDGSLLGHTPWDREQDSVAGTEQIRIEAAGFQAQTISMYRDRDSDHSVLLIANPAPPDLAPAADRDKPRLGKSKPARRQPDSTRTAERPDSAKPKLKQSDVLED